MEGFLRQLSQFRQACPFLQRTPIAKLRDLSVTTVHSSHLKSVRANSPASLNHCVSEASPTSRRSCPASGSCFGNRSRSCRGCSRTPSNSNSYGNLQKRTTALNLLAEQCPIMSKAMAVHMARSRLRPRSQVNQLERNLNLSLSSTIIPPTELSSDLETKEVIRRQALKQSPTQPAFDYDHFYRHEIEKKHQDKSYRYFNNINRLAEQFPLAHLGGQKQQTSQNVTVWCSNDYLGMSRHPLVLRKMT